MPSVGRRTCTPDTAHRSVFEDEVHPRRATCSYFLDCNRITLHPEVVFFYPLSYNFVNVDFLVYCHSFFFCISDYAYRLSLIYRHRIPLHKGTSQLLAVYFIGFRFTIIVT